MAQGNKKTLGEIIKEDMKSKGINGSAVARMMKVNRQTINKIDARKTFDLEFLQKLKSASGLDYTQYAYENLVNTVAEPVSIYMTEQNSVTLTFNVRCIKAQMARFSEFIEEIEGVASKYEYKIT